MHILDKTEETKVFRDPIHGYIKVNHQIIWELIQTREIQRLRRIHQLGGNFQVYHTAEHSRFSHSLGVYEIIRRMVNEIASLHTYLSEEEQVIMMVAGLLHDLGHGPFSHFFETLIKQKHEEISIKIILSPSSQVNQVLSQYDFQLPDHIAKILAHTHPNPLLNEIISSQLDADRMDYLLRDAYETGTSYGRFDLERILRTMRVVDSHLCLKESGIHSIEDYIMARYHMYWQVYLHPDAKSFEILIQKLFERYEEIRSVYKIDDLEFFYAPFDLEKFHRMDENYFYAIISKLLDFEDVYIRDLADRILNRRLYDWMRDYSYEEAEQVKEMIKKRNLPLSLYTHEEALSSYMYRPYAENKQSKAIYVLDQKGELFPLSKKSEIVKALLKMETKTNRTFYFVKKKSKFDPI